MFAEKIDNLVRVNYNEPQRQFYRCIEYIEHSAKVGLERCEYVVSPDHLEDLTRDLEFEGFKVSIVEKEFNRITIRIVFSK